MTGKDLETRECKNKLGSITSVLFEEWEEMEKI